MYRLIIKDIIDDDIRRGEEIPLKKVGRNKKSRI